MICKVRRTIEKFHMPLKNSNVIVALSGGADSCALLTVLYELKDEYGFSLSACHVNHGIRGVSADEDENFCRDLCRKLGIEIEVLSADVPKIAKDRSIGLEECGRQVRYEWFSLFDNCLIATAHTLSDKCETLLLNITRGSGINGICSIPAVRGNIIRPLIECTRDDIECWCFEHNISFVNDETNSDVNYARNRIRNNVIPQLKEINSSFEQSVFRLTEAAYNDEDYFKSIIDDLLVESKLKDGYSVYKIISQHISVRRRLLAEIIKKETGVVPEQLHILSVEGILNGGKTEIKGSNYVEVYDGKICFNPVVNEFVAWEKSFEDFVADTPKGKATGRIFNRNELPPKQIVHNKVIDYDSVVGNLVLRNRRAGDKIKLAGSSCTKTLKKLFTEKHSVDRNNLWILADEEGILWVESIGCADRCKITKDTNKILFIGEEK